MANLSLGQILAAGAGNTIAFMTQFGRTTREVFAHLRRTYGDATDRTLFAAWNRTLRAQEAGMRFGSLADDRVVPLAQIPLSPLQQSPVPGAAQPRLFYTVQVEYRDPATRQPAYAVLVIESDDNLTRGELMSQVLDQWQRTQRGERGSDRIRGVQTGAPTEIEVTQIWRTR